MDKTYMINALDQLGHVFKSVSDEKKWPGTDIGLTEDEYNKFLLLVEQCKIYNGWFVPKNIRLALSNWAELLKKDKLNEWLDKKSFPSTKKVAVIAAGNIPLVGFHDVLSVLVSGNYLKLKCSSDDDKLMPFVLQLLCVFYPELKNQFEIVDVKLEDYDAVIATGSNNSSSHFEQYFSKVPNIIRKNRNSVAIITDKTTPNELELLGKDVFNYFGLGCRNVSRIFLPKDFVIDRFFEAMYGYNEIVNHNKYANNYDYQKAIHLMNGDDILDNGFLLTKEDERLHAPLGMVYFTRYNEFDEVSRFIKSKEEEIQCIVGEGAIPFGDSQKPSLVDYADNINTLDFLENL